MKDVYKMTVRFDLTDARERALAEYMQTLDVKKYHSRNNFIIDALADYVDLQSITREQHEEDIRSIIRERFDVLIDGYVSIDRVKFIDDICASAKGYEYLADVYLRAEAKNEGRV